MKELILNSQERLNFLGELLDAVYNRKESVTIYCKLMSNGELKITVIRVDDKEQENGQNDNNEVLDSRAAAKYIHHGYHWLAHKKNREVWGIPSHHSAGKTVYYRKELDKWLKTGKYMVRRRGRPKRNVEDLIE